MSGSTTTLVVLSVADIAALIAGLAIYLWIVGTQLTRIAGNLEECSETVDAIVADASLITPGVESINHTGGIVAGALPLLYGMAEGIVAGATYEPADEPEERAPARPAMGTRRSRLHEGVGFDPDRATVVPIGNGNGNGNGRRRREPLRA